MKSPLSRIAIRCIAWYQLTLSPDTGWFSFLHPHGFCKYYPTCSEYTKQAIEKHGLGAGLLYGMRRIIKCNPFSRGGVDLVSK